MSLGQILWATKKADEGGGGRAVNTLHRLRTLVDCVFVTNMENKNTNTNTKMATIVMRAEGERIMNTLDLGPAMDTCQLHMIPYGGQHTIIYLYPKWRSNKGHL